MKYEDFEDQIINRLRKPGWEVTPLPLLDRLTEIRSSNKPQLFVIYHGSTFGEPENLGRTVQSEYLRFEVLIRTRQRRGEKGVFGVIDAVTELLLGFMPEKARSSVVFDSFGYVEGLTNNWQYSLTLSFESKIIEKVTPDQTGTIKSVGDITDRQ